MQAIHLADKFDKVKTYWTPKIIAELNGQYVKIARVKDEMIWHSHADEDELFYIHQGTLFMDFRDRTVELNAGDILVVPRGVEHRPRTDGNEVLLMLFEPKETKHTGEIQHEMTVEEQEWV